MDRNVLLTAVGFRPEMVLPLVQALRPQEVYLLSGRHGQIVETGREVQAKLREEKIPVQRQEVDDWDILNWSVSIQAALDRYKEDHVTVNLTAGHGLAVAMLAIHAAQRAIPVVCFDWEAYRKAGAPAKDLHAFVKPHSPAAVLNLKETQPIDRQILAQLLAGPKSVSELVETLKPTPQSTISTSLNRLLEKGFAERRLDGRNSVYSLLPGLSSMIAGTFGVGKVRG